MTSTALAPGRGPVTLRPAAMVAVLAAVLLAILAALGVLHARAGSASVVRATSPLAAPVHAHPAPRVAPGPGQAHPYTGRWVSEWPPPVVASPAAGERHHDW